MIKNPHGFPKSWTLNIQIFIETCKMATKYWQIQVLKVNCLLIYKLKINQSSNLIQHFEADFLWKVSLKILNSGIILKALTH